MSATTLILAAVFAAFGLYSSYVMLEVGYFGIWSAGIANAASLQVLLDLVITCLLISSWMVIDARRNGRNAWPYVLLTLAAGSFGPLLYLLVGRLATRKSSALLA
ncbi:MAG TPA: DUF2834 domain-containing protein [Solimonas sp.]|nr:DUF2834 domain-containing protein [Solimonas sp.]